jgi:hypothetical protein
MSNQKYKQYIKFLHTHKIISERANQPLPQADWSINMTPVPYPPSSLVRKVSNERPSEFLDWIGTFIGCGVCSTLRKS